MTKKDGALPEILAEWEKKQVELKKKGMEEKKLSNVAQDMQRNMVTWQSSLSRVVHSQSRSRLMTS